MKKILCSLVSLFAFAFINVNAFCESYFSGNGGDGLRIEINKPVLNNMNEESSWINSFVVDTFSDDIARFSKIKVIDTNNIGIIQNAQKRDGSAYYSEAQSYEIGNFSVADEILITSITKKVSSYMLSFKINDKETNTLLASYNIPNCTAEELENGYVFKLALSELLLQRGVKLTESGKKALLSTGGYGTQIVYQGVQYVVTNNSFENTQNDEDMLKNFSSTSKVFKNLRKEHLKSVGITQYIELCPTIEIKMDKNSDTPSVREVYQILSKDKKLLATISHKWQSPTMFDKTDSNYSTPKQQADAFRKLSEAEIRQKEPDYLTFKTMPDFYKDDLSKCIEFELTYKRDSDGKIVRDSKGNIEPRNNLIKDQVYFGFHKIGNYVYNSYSIYYRDKSRFWNINDLKDCFSAIRISDSGTIKIDAKGDGKINGNHSTSFNKIVQTEVKKIENNNISIYITEKKKDEITKEIFIKSSSKEKNKITVSVDSKNGEPVKKSFDLFGYEDDYIEISKEQKTLYKGTKDEITVPSYYTIKAPFLDKGELSKYTKARLYPKKSVVQGKNVIIYEIDTESFVKKWDSSFEKETKKK